MSQYPLTLESAKYIADLLCVKGGAIKNCIHIVAIIDTPVG